MTLLNKTNTLVIVPAYNEQDSIVSVIEEIKATGFSFVVIDDGSTDETRNRAIAAGARTISLPFNAGVGGSLKCGFQHAVRNGFRAIIQCDADGQHPTQNFESLVNHANTHSKHLVIGSRFTSDEESMYLSKTRRFAMRMLSSVAKRMNQVEVTDTTSGFRLIAQPLLGQFAERFPGYYLGDTFEALNLAKKYDYAIDEIGVPISDRASGKSSANLLHASMSYLKVITIEFFGIGIKIGVFDQSKSKKSTNE